MWAALGQPSVGPQCSGGGGSPSPRRSPGSKSSIRNSTSSCVSPMWGLQMSSSVSAGRKASAPRGSGGHRGQALRWMGSCSQSPSILAPESRALGALLPCWAHKCLSADPQARSDVSRWIMSPSPLRVRTDASYLAPTTVKPPHSQVGTAHFVTLVFAHSQARIDVMAHRQQ